MEKIFVKVKGENSITYLVNVMQVVSVEIKPAIPHKSVIKMSNGDEVTIQEDPKKLFAGLIVE